MLQDISSRNKTAVGIDLLFCHHIKGAAADIVFQESTSILQMTP
jgi:hypothetical protein